VCDGPLTAIFVLAYVLVLCLGVVLLLLVLLLVVVAGVQGTIELPFAELSDGLWFIEGANGAGKSTVLEAIAWCQFGEFLRSGMKAEFAINDLAVERGGACLVRIDFANGYSIERIRNSKKKTQSVQVSCEGLGCDVM